ncbi:hypothetical protein Bpfe_018100, partial [Biomphalaria pfeifferi]
VPFISMSSMGDPHPNAAHHRCLIYPALHPSPTISLFPRHSFQKLLQRIMQGLHASSGADGQTQGWVLSERTAFNSVTGHF